MQQASVTGGGQRYPVFLVCRLSTMGGDAGTNCSWLRCFPADHVHDVTSWPGRRDTPRPLGVDESQKEHPGVNPYDQRDDAF
jgi:hypothetical protein